MKIYVIVCCGIMQDEYFSDIELAKCYVESLSNLYTLDVLTNKKLYTSEDITDDEYDSIYSQIRSNTDIISVDIYEDTNPLELVDEIRGKLYGSHII